MSIIRNVFHECVIYGITNSEYNRMLMESDLTDHSLENIINYVINKVEDREFIVLPEYGIILADVPSENKDFVDLIYKNAKKYIEYNKEEFRGLLNDYKDALYNKNMNSIMNAIQFSKELNEKLGVIEAPMTIVNDNLIIFGVSDSKFEEFTNECLGKTHKGNITHYNHPSFTNVLSLIEGNDKFKTFKFTNTSSSMTIIIFHNGNENTLKLANDFMHKFKCYDDVYNNINNIQFYLKLIFNNSNMSTIKRNDIIKCLKLKPITNYLSWDDTFMNMANLVALRSKDPKTKVGSVIVKDSVVLGVGYNGMPRGCSDIEYPWTKDSEDAFYSKHSYVVHAEANAILNASGSVKGATIYVSLFPCNECAKLIIQSGITEVVFHDAWDEDKVEVRTSKRMFNSAGVKIRQVKTFTNVINTESF